MKPPGSNLYLEHSNGAYWMRLTRGENGTSIVAPVDLGDAVLTSKEPGAVERSRHELTHMPYRSCCASAVSQVVG